MSQELRLEVIVDPALPPVVEGAVSFETGASELGLHVYGPPSPLQAFYEDLISGAPMPLVFAAKGVSGPHTALAAALFMDRTLVLHPSTVGFVYLVDLYSRIGDAALAHTDPSVAHFLSGVRSVFRTTSRDELGRQLSLAVNWFRDHLLEGSVPNLGGTQSVPDVLDVGSNGFVLAWAKAPSRLAWESLFRWGHLKGVLIGDPNKEGFRDVIIARKTVKVGFELERVHVVLNELESLAGNTLKWNLEGNYLCSPFGGSAILIRHVVNVLVRS